MRAPGTRLFALGRQVPVVTIVIDSPANIGESFDVVDEVTADEGLVTCEMVPALVSDEGDGGHGGRPRMARHSY